MDISTWRLPPYVDQAFHRTELGHDGLANAPSARIGQLASVQVQFHEEATVPDMSEGPRCRPWRTCCRRAGLDPALSIALAARIRSTG